MLEFRILFYGSWKLKIFRDGEEYRVYDQLPSVDVVLVLLRELMSRIK